MNADLHILITILEALELGVLVTGLSEDDSPILYANASFERLTGYPRPELVGRNCRLLQGPESDPATVERIREAVRTGEFFDGEIVNYRKDGTSFLNRLRIHPVRAARGMVTHFVGIQSDVTSERAELARSEERYRMLIEHAPYGIFALDPEGVFTEMNRAGQEILARSAGELVGRSFREVVAPEDLPTVAAAFEQVLTGVPDGTELSASIIRPDGEARSLQIIMIRLEGLGRRSFYGIARDVTELRGRDLHLRRVERLASLGTLIAAVAHELNNPLTAIRGFAQLLLMDPRSDEDRESLELIQREADRMAKIVADLRLVARESQDKATLGDVDVNDVVRHVLRVREYHLRTYNVATDVRLAPDLPPATGSRPDLEQVILNLVTNAEQAFGEAAESRVITVRSFRSAAWISVEIADNGPGIPGEHLGRIFDPFFTTKDPGEGTGLGLSLVQRILEGHGGEIAVQSTVGSGTTFTVRLPHSPEPRPAAPQHPDTHRSSVSAQAPRRLRILVIDDEEAIRRSVSRYLTRRGHTVLQAAEGREALRYIETTDVDVILSDIRMPGLSGLALLQHLPQSAPLMARKVIFFTGDAAGSGLEAVEGQPGNRVLMKPLDFHTLAAVVEATPLAASPADLVDIGGVMLAEVKGIRDAFVARLRREPGFAVAAEMADADLEDQTCTLLTDLSQLLTIHGSRSADRGGLLRDNELRVRLVAQLHGQQRARQGWTYSMVSAEFPILLEEIERGLAAAAPDHLRGGTADALRILLPVMDAARELSLGAWRTAVAPLGSADPFT